MEFPIKQELDPSVITTLINVDMELNKGSDGLIHIFLKPVGLPIIIDVPWTEPDLVVMLNAWLAGLRGRDNGSET